jgi:hypothetical protein
MTRLELPVVLWVAIMQGQLEIEIGVVCYRDPRDKVKQR